MRMTLSHPACLFNLLINITHFSSPFALWLDWKEKPDNPPPEELTGPDGKDLRGLCVPDPSGGWETESVRPEDIRRASAEHEAGDQPVEGEPEQPRRGQTWGGDEPTQGMWYSISVRYYTCPYINNLQSYQVICVHDENILSLFMPSRAQAAETFTHLWSWPKCD